MTHDVVRGRVLMEKLKNGVDSVLKVICISLFAILVIVVLWQVFTRQVLNNPSIWSEELGKYLFVWLSFFALTLLFSERSHIAVTFLATKTPQKVQIGVSLFVNTLIIVWSGMILVVGGWQASVNAWGQNLSALPVSIGPMYLCMPLCGVLIIFSTVYQIVKILQKQITPFSVIDVDSQNALSSYEDEAARPVEDGTDISTVGDDSSVKKEGQL